MTGYLVGISCLFLFSFALLSAFDTRLLKSSLRKGALMNLLAWLAGLGFSAILFMPFNFILVMLAMSFDSCSSNPQAMKQAELISVTARLIYFALIIAIAIAAKIWMMRSVWKQQLSKQSLLILVCANTLIPALNLAACLTSGLFT